MRESTSPIRTKEPVVHERERFDWGCGGFGTFSREGFFIHQNPTCESLSLENNSLTRTLFGGKNGRPDSQFLRNYDVVF